MSNNSWNNSEDVPYIQPDFVNHIKGVKPHIIGNTLNVIYKNAWSGWTNIGVLISHSYRNINDNQWTYNQQMLESDWYSVQDDIFYPHVSANTSDGKIHLIYWDKNNTKYSYRQLNGTTFSNHITEIPLAILSTSLNAVSNDLYLVRTDNPITPGNIKLRHYDAAPLAPQNLAVTTSSNNHPLLTWSGNNEPDIQQYKIYKWTYAELGWFHYATTTSTSFEDVNEIIQGGGHHANERWVYYRVTAVDQYPNESPNSNQVGIKVKGAALDKFSTGTDVYDYSLSQNYPNPFNPSTKISYSIKEDGFVTLKVYDILGVEIATLVNEQKTAGSYEADFNAANLPSGMYIYKLQSVNPSTSSGQGFTDVKKMLLTK